MKKTIASIYEGITAHAQVVEVGMKLLLGKKEVADVLQKSLLDSIKVLLKLPSQLSRIARHRAAFALKMDAVVVCVIDGEEVASQKLVEIEHRRDPVR